MKLGKKAIKQILILRYTVSRLRKYFVSRLENTLYFYQVQILIWLYFSLYKGIYKTWFLILARQTRRQVSAHTKFLLTQKIKNKVSSNKR